MSGAAGVIWNRGPEFLDRAALRWLARAKIETAYNDPGKPLQYAAGQSFIGKFRDERLSFEWSRDRIDVTILSESWRRHYKESRQHSSLGYLTPALF